MNALFEFKKARRRFGWPAIFLGAPHASPYVPPQSRMSIPKWKLRSHEGFDPGSREVALKLYFAMSAHLVLGGISRLVAELNRRISFAAPDSVPVQQREGFLAAFYVPYVRTVRNVIANGFVARGKLPLFVDVHTCTRIMPNIKRRSQTDGYGRKSFSMTGGRRAPFGVEGDADSLFMIVFWENLRRSFYAAAAKGELKGISELNAQDYKDPVGFNRPYDLAKGSPFRDRVQGVEFAEEQGLLGLTFEVRNDIAKKPAIQKIVTSALKRTIRDPRVNAELRRAERARFPSRSKPYIQRKAMTAGMR